MTSNRNAVSLGRLAPLARTGWWATRRFVVVGLRVYFAGIQSLICLGNVQDDWPKLFRAFSVKFTLIFSCVRSFNHSTSAGLESGQFEGKASWP